MTKVLCRIVFVYFMIHLFLAGSHNWSSLLAWNEPGTKTLHNSMVKLIYATLSPQQGPLISKKIYVTLCMLCTTQLPGPVLKAFGRAQFSPLQLADKSPMITDQHSRGLSKPIKPTGQALTLINPFHKRHYYIHHSDITKNDFVFYLTTSWVYIISLTQQNKICAFMVKNFAFMVKNKCRLS